MFYLKPTTNEDHQTMLAVLRIYKVHTEKVESIKSITIYSVRSIEGHEDDYHLAEMAMEMNFHQVPCPGCPDYCGHLCFSKAI
jgi:hypothetical protein